MRFISKYARYSVCFQRDVVHHYPGSDGAIVTQEIKPLINMQFDNWGTMYPWEIEQGMTKFQFQGQPVEIDEVTPITPMYRLSVLDTELYCSKNSLPATLAPEMDEFLRTRPEYGIDYIASEKPVLALPWPNYGKYKGESEKTLDALTQSAHAVGFTESPRKMAELIEYERMTDNRPKVIAAFENMVPPVAEEAELVSA